MKKLSRILVVVALAVAGVTTRAEIVATYLGNEGVLVTYGESKVLFDPIYRNGFDQYELVPAQMEAAIFSGEAPFDGVNAVFVSHHHGDHFSAEHMAQLMMQQTGLRLYAPVQAVAAMLPHLPDDDTIFSRMIGIHLEYGDPAMVITEGALKIGAVRVPHSGWPDSMADVQNLAFRVTLHDEATVLHLGDADTSDTHYEKNAGHWSNETIDMAFPPYWYFSSGRGRHVLSERLKPRHSVGIHVPAKMPDNPTQRPPEYRGYDLFTRPGQTRRIEAN